MRMILLAWVICLITIVIICFQSELTNSSRGNATSIQKREVTTTVPEHEPIVLSSVVTVIPASKNNIRKSEVEPELESVQFTSKNKVIINNNAPMLIPRKPDKAPNDIIRGVLNNASIVPDSDKDPLSDCAVTSQFRLQTNTKPWILTALDIKGNPKKIGGDEFYVSYYHNTTNRASMKDPTAVAEYRDLNIGSYELYFSTTPMNPYSEVSPANSQGEGGIIVIYLSYTCYMADLSPPTKHSWSQGGLANTHYTVWVNSPPPMKRFVPPILPSDVKTPVDHVLCVGDSMMLQFAGEWPKTSNWYRSNGSFSSRFSSPLNSKQSARRYVELMRENIHSSTIQDKLKATGKEKPHLLVLMGSGVWDIVEDESRFAVQDKLFTQHKEAIKTVLSEVNSLLQFQNFTIQFAWKSNTVSHPHVVHLGYTTEQVLQRTKYATYTRSRRIYQIQKKVMQDFNIPFLDIYHASYLSATYHRDTSHFVPEFNLLMWNWFFPQDNKVEEIA